MTKTTKIIVIVLSFFIVVNLAWAIYDIRRELIFNKILSQGQINENNASLDNVFTILKLMNITDNLILGSINGLNKQIKNLPDKIKYDKFLLEKRLQCINVLITNKTIPGLGSGVTLKYKDKYYILTAGHMLNEKTDIITFSQNGQDFGECDVIKWDYDPTATGLNKQDLLLLKPKNTALQPKIYVELADTEPFTASEVYIVGNPMGIENAVSIGRVLFYKENYMIISDNIYFGNSGGGVYTTEGKLAGIVSFLADLKPNTMSPSWVIYGIVRLDTIKKFLGDVK